MKVTRSYWLGLGSGLILSAMLILVISPQQGQAVIPQEPSSGSAVHEQLSPIKEGANQPDPSPASQPIVSNQTSQGASSNTQNPANTIEQPFVIPSGVSSEWIADLLVAQGFLKDKASFSERAHQMGVESKFRAGTFSLSRGLTPEELIQRLLKK